MFTPEYFIDAVQNTKRQIVDTFVQDERIKKSLQAYIDAQTIFVKVAAKNAVEFAQLTIENAIKPDYPKYFTKK
jgi:hypothetical protein